MDIKKAIGEGFETAVKENQLVNVYETVRGVVTAENDEQRMDALDEGFTRATLPGNIYQGVKEYRQEVDAAAAPEGKLRPYEAHDLRSVGHPVDESQVESLEVHRQPGVEKPALEGSGIYAYEGKDRAASSEAFRGVEKTADGAVLRITAREGDAGWDDFNMEHGVYPSEAFRKAYDELSASAKEQIAKEAGAGVSASYQHDSGVTVGGEFDGRFSKNEQPHAGDQARADLIGPAALGQDPYEGAKYHILEFAVRNAEEGKPTDVVIENGDQIPPGELQKLAKDVVELRDQQGVDIRLNITGQGPDGESLEQYLRHNDIQVEEGQTPPVLEPKQDEQSQDQQSQDLPNPDQHEQDRPEPDQPGTDESAPEQVTPDQPGEQPGNEAQESQDARGQAITGDHQQFEPEQVAPAVEQLPDHNYRPDENPGQVSPAPYQDGASFVPANHQPGVTAPTGDIPNFNGFGFDTQTQFDEGTLKSQTTFETPIGGAQLSAYIGQEGIGFNAHGIPANQPIDGPDATVAQPNGGAQSVGVNQQDETAAPAEQPAVVAEQPSMTTSHDLSAELDVEVNVSYNQATYEQPQPALDQSVRGQSTPEQLSDQQGTGQGTAAAEAQAKGKVGVADLAADADGEVKSIQNQAPTAGQQIPQHTQSI